MCVDNDAQHVCGTPLSFYRNRGRQTGFRWCLLVRAQILFHLRAHNVLPVSETLAAPEFDDVLLPYIRSACNMVHQGDFSAVVHPSFDRLVRHLAKTWGLANGLVSPGSPGNPPAWNMSIVDKWFGRVEDVEAWLKTLQSNKTTQDLTLQLQTLGLEETPSAEADTGRLNPFAANAPQGTWDESWQTGGGASVEVGKAPAQQQPPPPLQPQPPDPEPACRLQSLWAVTEETLALNPWASVDESHAPVSTVRVSERPETPELCHHQGHTDTTDNMNIELEDAASLQAPRGERIAADTANAVKGPQDTAPQWPVVSSSASWPSRSRSTPQAAAAWPTTTAPTAAPPSWPRTPTRQQQRQRPDSISVASSYDRPLSPPSSPSAGSRAPQSATFPPSTPTHTSSPLSFSSPTFASFTSPRQPRSPLSPLSPTGRQRRRPISPMPPGSPLALRFATLTESSWAARRHVVEAETAALELLFFPERAGLD